MVAMAIAVAAVAAEAVAPLVVWRVVAAEAQVVAVAAVCCHHRGLLRFYLVYIFATLMFCVLYHVFQLDEKMSVWGYTMLALAVILAILIWAQLYYAMYFLRILDFYDA